MDDKNGLLSGSIPLRIRVVDPLGETRYDLYRATDRGTVRLRLPLAINDPAGTWKVQVTELLNHKTGTASFTLKAVPSCGVAGGASKRALFLADDRERAFRFFRTHQDVTVVTGTSAYNTAAAERLARVLAPWDVKCKIVKAADVNKPRTLTPAEAPTWVGLEPGRAEPGAKNNPSIAGFAVRGPVVLLGTPEDNPLIKFLLDKKFLPYVPDKANVPGPGRGLVAWQLDALGAGQESLTLIAYDGKGMDEAVGTTYEMAAGLEPLTPLALPRRNTITVATKARTLPAPTVAWSAVLPDRVVGLKADGGKLSALSHDGTLATVDTGKVAMRRVVEGGAYAAAVKDLGTPTTGVAAAQKKIGPRRLVKFVVADGKRTAVACWGGIVRILSEDGTLRAVYRSPQDVTALVWSGGQLVVGDADGRLTALTVK